MMMKRSAILLLAALYQQPAIAATPTFENKTIEVTVGTAPGGGNDLVARLVTRHLGRHLPGRPNMIVSNIPGAGGIIQANYMSYRAPKDGLSIGYINRQLAMQQLANNPGIRFDVGEFQWIGALSKEPIVVFIRRSKDLQSIDAMKRSTTPIVFAVRAKGGTDYLAAKAIESLGVQLKIVSGYGAGQTTVAFEQGEVDASALAETAFRIRREWSRPGGLAIPVLSFGTPVDKLPFAGDLHPIASRTAVYSLINKALGLPLGTFAGPPEMPRDIVAAYAASFSRMARDQDFLNDATKSGLDIDLIDGPAAKDLFRAFMAAPGESKKELTELMQ